MESPRSQVPFHGLTLKLSGPLRPLTFVVNHNHPMTLRTVDICWNCISSPISGAGEPDYGFQIAKRLMVFQFDQSKKAFVRTTFFEKPFVSEDMFATYTAEEIGQLMGGN